MIKSPKNEYVHNEIPEKELKGTKYGDKDNKEFSHKRKKKFSWDKAKEITGKILNNPIAEFIIELTPKPMKNALNWLKSRFKEPSTYKGISVVASAIGISISPDLWQAIAALGAGIIGLIQVIENESKKNK